MRKRYVAPGGIVEALHPTDATFAPGRITAVVGPSGSGKSTLLRLVAGLEGADAGALTAGDSDVTALAGRALRAYRRDVVTYVAQRAAANLVAHLRLRDQLDGPDAATLLEQVGLTGHLAARPGQLSGGEQARAALALAAARATPVLLLDEPTAELDRDSASHVLDVLAGAAARGRTVVVATHDEDVIAAATTVVDLAVTPADAPSMPAHHPAAGGTGIHPRGLTKRYADTHAVEDVAFDLEPGELGVVLGRSGSGKSTLLMILGGWLAADSGDTGVAGTAWAQLGYLPQRFGLLPELSVAENIGLPLRIAGAGDAPAELLERLDLASLAARLPGETSIGQQQRAALARALVCRPAVLLADEPTSHQDGRSAARVWHAIEAARDGGTACLVATHDPAAVAHADRVWELVDGHIIAGPPPLPP